jgi:diaminohydroxyphosphoribosylaminopyrimidine deaminase/5-amino-6-(5-phosphoribosylamino)uracil reductase
MSAADAEQDSVYMRRALDLARKGWGQTAPNPMVGAVVVRDGEIVGEGYHARYGQAHAEVNALNAARGRTRGATIYVTLEPCAHHGKTPPCVNAIIEAGIGRVVVAVRDPTFVAGGGAERLRSAGIHVDIGIERGAACELNAPFFAAGSYRRPWVTLKLAISADRAVADPTGVHRWITGIESRQEVHRMRANSDAILVGIGTVLADDPELTVRDAPPPRIIPHRVVLDSRLRIPLNSKLVQTANEIDTRVIASNTGLPTEQLDGLRSAGVRVSIAGDADGSSLNSTLETLRSSDDVRSLLVEAGPRIAGSFLSEAHVDRLVIFQSPLVLGDGAPKAFAFAPQGFEASLQSLRVVERRKFGDDVMTTYALRDVPCSPD